MPTLRRQGLVIVATLATAYVASHFFRASNVTIGLDLMRDLAIGPEALGALTGAFFFGFSAMQIPAGFLFDRYGPRRTICALLLLAVLGAVVLATVVLDDSVSSTDAPDAEPVLPVVLPSLDDPAAAGSSVPHASSSSDMTSTRSGFRVPWLRPA